MHRLLLIDEEPADRKTSATVLSLLFPEASLDRVGRGTDFFEVLQSGPFDVVITELGIKWADWQCELEAIHAMQPGATIIVYSEEEVGPQESAILASEAFAYVQKGPRGYLELGQAVDRALEARPRPAVAAREAPEPIDELLADHSPSPEVDIDELADQVARIVRGESDLEPEPGLNTDPPDPDIPAL